MVGTRYEEYTKFEDNLPFKLALGIKVTSTTYSTEANWHDNLEIQFCAEGAGYVLMDTIKHPLDAKHIAVINSNVIHHTNTENTVVYDCLIIDTAFCRQMDIDTSFIRFTPSVTSDVFLKLYERLKSIYINTQDVCRTAKLNEIIIKMLIYLRENHNLKDDGNKIGANSFETIKKAIRYIRENYNQKLSLERISKNIYIDKYTLSREFKKLTNQTVIQYINSYRCKKARDYISGGTSVSDAARMCGFTNMSFFTKTFKKYIGCMPHSFKN